MGSSACSARDPSPSRGPVLVPVQGRTVGCGLVLAAVPPCRRDFRWLGPRGHGPPKKEKRELGSVEAGTERRRAGRRWPPPRGSFLPDPGAVGVGSDEAASRLAAERFGELGDVRQRAEHPEAAGRVGIGGDREAQRLRADVLAPDLGVGQEEALLRGEAVDRLGARACRRATSGRAAKASFTPPRSAMFSPRVSLPLTCRSSTAT